MPKPMRLAIAASALWPGMAYAAGDSMVTQAGHRLARQWCAERHLVEKDHSHAASSMAPSFLTVADDPAVTETGLRAFLSSPHMN
ncbi:MAG: hypothetical protein ACREEE_15380, partial [Dongiaceae bacterium]